MPGVTPGITAPLNLRILAEVRQLIHATRLFDVSVIPDGGDIEDLFTLE
jgi:hypothetical protein